VFGLAVSVLGQNFHNAALANLSSSALNDDPSKLIAQNLEAGDLLVNGPEVTRSNTVDLATVPLRLIGQV